MKLDCLIKKQRVESSSKVVEKTYRGKKARQTQGPERQAQG